MLIVAQNMNGENANRLQRSDIWRMGTMDCTAER